MSTPEELEVTQTFQVADTEEMDAGSPEPRLGEPPVQTTTEPSTSSPGYQLNLVDHDIDSLSFDFEEHGRQLKHSIMGRIYEVKRKLLLHNRTALEHQLQIHVKELADKQEQVENSKDQALQQKIKCETSRIYLYRAVICFANAKEDFRGLLQCVAAWRKWVAFTHTRKDLKRKLRRAVRHYDRNSILRGRIRKWAYWTRVSARAKAEQAHVIQMAKAKQEEAAAAAHTIERLRSELAATRAALAQSDSQRLELEENMKQAFMRGVCALNIEAMQVMKRGKLSSSGRRTVSDQQLATPTVPSAETITEVSHPATSDRG